MCGRRCPRARTRLWHAAGAHLWLTFNSFRNFVKPSPVDSANMSTRLEVLGSTCPECEGVGHKFPRSSHLANLGAATHDDLLLDANARALFVGKQAGVVTLEEKMDGGNIGISLDKHGRYMFQKRAHFVSSESEPQYAQLETWWGCCAVLTLLAARPSVCR